jgi:hypothetical protein
METWELECWKCQPGPGIRTTSDSDEPKEYVQRRQVEFDRGRLAYFHRAGVTGRYGESQIQGITIQALEVPPQRKIFVSSQPIWMYPRAIEVRNNCLRM